MIELKKIGVGTIALGVIVLILYAIIRAPWIGAMVGLLGLAYMFGDILVKEG